jgi:imidazolonepropionase-like amidohydrolase
VGRGGRGGAPRERYRRRVSPRPTVALVWLQVAAIAVVGFACRASPPSSAPSPSSRPTLAIVGATVVHPDGPRASDPEQTILIAGHRIVTVGPAASTAIPAGARVVDGHGKWVIPGLIDGHVHFFQSANPYTRPDAFDATDVVPYADEVARNKARLAATFQVWLASGVTSVVDAGGPMWNFDVRTAAAATALAPRVQVAGPLISMVSRSQLALDDPPIIQVSSPEEARALAERLVARRPELVKVWFIHRPGDDLAKQEAIVRAAAEVAHAAGARFAVHATELTTAKAALRAGADVLVHSVADAPVDDEFLDLARRNQAIYVPTLFVPMGYQLAVRNRWEPTAAERRLADPQVLASMSGFAAIAAKYADRVSGDATPNPVPLANLRRVWDAGITVALGTDAGNPGTLHGPGIFREAADMARGGLSPREVLRSATVNGAKLLGMTADLGAVAPGKLAELVILDADPLASVDNLAAIHRVVKNGQLLDPDELIRSLRGPAGAPAGPAQIVQVQLEAYNRGDLEAFVSTYGPDVRMYNHPDKLTTSGLDAVRATYGKLFASAPGLKATVTSRIVQGNFVIDHEHVTGLDRDGELRAVAIYEVRDGKIRNVWFLR